MKEIISNYNMPFEKLLDDEQDYSLLAKYYPRIKSNFELGFICRIEARKGKSQKPIFSLFLRTVYSIRDKEYIERGMKIVEELARKEIKDNQIHDYEICYEWEPDPNNKKPVEKADCNKWK